MDIGIIVFAYNRSRHLKKVLDGLKENEGVSKLYIFQDGLKCEDHRSEWENTQQVIKGIDWCEVVYNLSLHNKGLASSIVDGISTVFGENDAVIVLEDDCVPTANFIGFMRQCFDKYKNDKRVYSVSGYAWPIDLFQNEYDIYGCGRISSWGWGTWKDRWEQYNTDSTVLQRLKADKDKSRYLAAWGKDLERMFLDRLAGRNDSWGVYWGLTVIENAGICINPYKSLIHNIGMDGTGVHSGVTNLFETKLDVGTKRNFNLPINLDILHTTESAFADLYGSFTATSVKDTSKENVLIYGLGSFFDKYEREINNNYNIVALIDQRKKGWYAGKRIIGLNNVKNYDYDKVIIMVQSIQQCIQIVKSMISNGIQSASIILGHNLYGKYSKLIDEISITLEGRIFIKVGELSLNVESEDEFNNVCEIFLNHTYNYYINNTKRDIVLDVGMNIGASSLYFANQENVDKVYGYETFKKTFIRAKENLRQYLSLGKVNIFQYGISDENAIRTISFNSGMTCGQSTLEDVRKYAYSKYQNWGLVQETDKEIEQIEVRKASTVFEPIFNKYPHHNIVLKMDCEGEEYNILKELSQSKMLERFQFVMMEWHYRGKEIILDYLLEAGFSWWCSEKDEDLGFIYAYK